MQDVLWEINVFSITMNYNQIDKVNKKIVFRGFCVMEYGMVAVGSISDVRETPTTAAVKFVSFNNCLSRETQGAIQSIIHHVQPNLRAPV